MSPTATFKSWCSLLLLLQTATHALAGSQFASHVSINTPARSFSHGVGDPIPTRQRQPQRPFASMRRPITQRHSGGGYPRVKPTIPFNYEDVTHDNTLKTGHWQQNSYNYNSFKEVSIPVLPPSPYKVDSPDPESLWPVGLFLPPLQPHRFGYDRRADNDRTAESDPMDPYLLEGSEAIAAVRRANAHGFLYFHDIPHIDSLLANQELRAQNQLKPHRIGSIRHTWPYNRP